jgi:hypothetical protein
MTMSDLLASSSSLRRVALIVIGVFAGATIITPAVTFAAKFLTPKMANTTFVRNMSAERGGSGTIFAGAPPRFLNVTIDAPTKGFLLLQGSARFDNEESSGQDLAELSYQVDGKQSVTGGEATLGPDATPNQQDPGETAQVAYVDVVPVDRGAHTVRQLVSATEGGPGGGPPGSGIHVDYSSAALVVTFFPGKGATVK